jgi:ligand-binding SRPBCC domain-containing protein
LLGHSQKLAFRIAELTAPSLIAVEQLRGPFRSWREQNQFEVANSATRLAYSVDFVPPGGLLGFFATPERIMTQLEQGFRERRERTGPLIAASQSQR